MAGIGFELRKLFDGKGFIKNLKAYFISSIVTVGPMFLCITLTTALQLLLRYIKVDFSERELFSSAVVYGFVFSLLMASTFIMLVSRYISDKVFMKDYDQIMASIYGVLAIVLTIGGVIGLLFYINSPLDFYFKLAAYIFYMELIVIWIQAIYISLFKEYNKILMGFLTGVITAIVLSVVSVIFIKVKVILLLMVSIDVGFFVIMFSYMRYFSRFLSDKDKNIFNFVAYIDKYPSLIFICFFYNLGMYVHNFIFWLSSHGIKVGNTYYCSPFYDVPMFYAYFTILPTLVLFVVKVETSFMPKYKQYFDQIVNGGNYKQIEISKGEMTTVLYSEISHIMEVQLFFSIIFFLVGRKLLPMVGLSSLSVDIYNILVMGCYIFVMMFIVLLILLYFDDRKGGFMTATTFLFSNVIFTLATLKLGENYYGLGFFVSALISFILALLRLMYYLKNINYYTFCYQPILYKEQVSFFTRLSSILEKRNKSYNAEGGQVFEE